MIVKPDAEQFHDVGGFPHNAIDLAIAESIGPESLFSVRRASDENGRNEQPEHLKPQNRSVKAATIHSRHYAFH